MSPRSPLNPLTDAAPLLFRGLWEVEFRTLRNGDADLGSSPLLSLLESGGVAARAGDVPAHRGVQAGWPAGPAAGVRRGGGAWSHFRNSEVGLGPEGARRDLPKGR